MSSSPVQTESTQAGNVVIKVFRNGQNEWRYEYIILENIPDQLMKDRLSLICELNRTKEPNTFYLPSLSELLGFL